MVIVSASTLHCTVVYAVALSLLWMMDIFFLFLLFFRLITLHVKICFVEIVANNMKHRVK